MDQFLVRGKRSNALFERLPKRWICIESTLQRTYAAITELVDADLLGASIWPNSGVRHKATPTIFASIRMNG